MRWGDDARTTEPALDGPEWLTAPDAARLARMNIDTLREHRQKGDIVGYNGMTGEAFGTEAVLGGYLLRFKRSDVIDMMKRIRPWMLVALPTAWRKRARCRGLGAAETERVFFPEPGKPYTEALSYCRACPVRRDCLEWATMVGCEAGIFGGATGPQLLKFNAHWRRTGTLPKLCSLCGTVYSNATAYCSTECRDADHR